MIGMMAVIALTAALTPFPAGINEYVRRASERSSVLGEIRRDAARAVSLARKDGVRLIELEFPPLLGSKTQFDDFSNVEELDANRDLAMQLSVAPEFAVPEGGKTLWLVLPDKGEVELAQQAWPGEMYRQATITSIGEAVASQGGAPQAAFGAEAAEAGERCRRVKRRRVAQLSGGRTSRLEVVDLPLWKSNTGADPCAARARREEACGHVRPRVERRGRRGGRSGSDAGTGAAACRAARQRVSREHTPQIPWACSLGLCSRLLGVWPSRRLVPAPGGAAGRWKTG